MELNETLLILKKIELFRDLNENEFKELAKSVREKNYAPYDLLFRENGPSEDIFIIYNGEVEFFKSNSYGVETKLTLFGKGDLAHGQMIPLTQQQQEHYNPQLY
jgi:signal-transduction protein with cAMP-binding, CBS, and nucleotidyltransferase domain